MYRYENAIKLDDAAAEAAAAASAPVIAPRSAASNRFKHVALAVVAVEKVVNKYGLSAEDLVSSDDDSDNEGTEVIKRKRADSRFNAINPDAAADPDAVAN